MEKKAIRGVPWTVLSFAANKSVSTLTTLVLARLLAPADFGIIAIALIVVNFLFWFGGLGFAATLVVRQDLDELGQATTLTLMLASGVIAAAIAAALSPVIASVFGNPRVTDVLLALTSLFVINSFTSFYDSMLQRELEFRRRFATLSVQTISFAVLAISLAASGMGVWSLAIGQIGANLLYAAALLALVPRRVWPRFERARGRSLVLSGRGFLAQGVTVFIRQNADTVTVGAVFGSVAAGFYSMAYRLGDLSYSAIADPVVRVTFPAFARTRERGGDIGGPFLSVLRLVALVGCPVGVILSAAAEPFTRAVLGTRWLPMAAPLAVLGIWSALRPLDATLAWLLNSVQRADPVAWLSVGILVPLVPGFILASSVGGLSAVAVVVVLDTMISLSVLVVFVRRYVEVQLHELWRSVGPIFIALPVAWAATFGAARAMGERHPALSLIIAAACGLAAYAVALTAQDRLLLRHAVDQLLRTLGHGPQAAPVGPSG